MREKYYRYIVELTDGGSEIRVDARDPEGNTMEEPGGPCNVAKQLPRLRQLADRARQDGARQSSLRELGEALFNALFPQEVMGNFRERVAKIMREEDAYLRLELDLDEAKLPQIAALPWEFLRAPQTSRRAGDNLATHPRIVLSRRRPLWGKAAPIMLEEPLRIQLIVSAPKDEELGPVAFEEVEAALQRLASRHPEQIAPPLKTLHEPNVTKIEDVLEAHKPHIVHFIGHGRLTLVRGVEFGELALVGPSGRTKWITDEKIGEIFQIHIPPIVLLQACESGSAGHSGAFIGAASQIVQRNVPVVVGMQYPVTNDVAVTFAEQFYRRLGELLPVDVAVQRSRRLLHNKFSGKRDFAAPALFMRVEDGRLFLPKPEVDLEDEPLEEKTAASAQPKVTFPDTFETDLPHPIAVTCATYNQAGNEQSQFEALDWLLNNFVKYITAVALSQYWQDDPDKAQLRSWLGALSEARLQTSLSLFDALHAHYAAVDDKPYLFPALFEPYARSVDDASPLTAVYETIRKLRQDKRVREEVTPQIFLARLIAYRESKWEKDAGKVDASIRASLLPDLALALRELLTKFDPLLRYPLRYIERVDSGKGGWVYTTIAFPGAAGKPTEYKPFFIEPEAAKPTFKDRRLYLCNHDGKPQLNLHPFLIYFVDKIYFLEQADDHETVSYQHCASSERYYPPEIYTSIFLNATKTKEDLAAEEDPVRQLQQATRQLEEEEDKERLDKMPLPILLTHLSEEGREALEIGLGESLRIGRFWIGLEFLLMGLSKQRGRPFPILLREIGFHPGEFRGALRGLIHVLDKSWRDQDPLLLGKNALPQLEVATPDYLSRQHEDTQAYPVVMTPRLKAILQQAYQLADEEKIGHRHLLEESLQHYRAPAVQILLGMASQAEWTPDQLYARLAALLNIAPHDLPPTRAPSAGLPRQSPRLDGRQSPAALRGRSSLEQLGHNLTQAAAEGKLSEAFGENAQRAMAEMGRVLLKKEGNNPILLGDSGVGKTAVVEGFAWRLTGHGKGVIPQLQDKQIIQISPAELTAGTKYRGDLEERLKQLVAQVKAAEGNIIIFIDEIHTILAGDSASGLSTISETLKPALARGEFPCIGATTVAEYRRYIERDPALVRRFSPVWLEEPTIEDAIKIVDHVANSRLTVHHAGISFNKKAIETAVELTGRYMHDEQLPGKAIKVLDEAASSLILGGSLSGGVTDATAAYGDRVTSDLVTAIVAAHTNIPKEQLAKSNKQRLRELEGKLKARIIGQDSAIERVARVLKRAGIGFANEKRPLGVFLFTGPTGVGKTELALAIAEALFDDEEAIFRLDMSEFMEKHQVARLIGAPPGYIRSEEEGQLTGRLRRRPYSVVLLDEMEKAHEDVQHLFLQLFDNGRLTDSHGNMADGRNAIFIMTTNLGAKEVMGFGRTPTYREKLKTAVYDHFSPEFMNRIDRIAYFEPLDEVALMAIFDKEFQPYQERFHNQGIRVEVPEKIKRQLVEQVARQKMGARPLQRAIENQIVTPLIDRLLEEEVPEGTIHVGEDVEVRAISLAPWAKQRPPADSAAGKRPQAPNPPDLGNFRLTPDLERPFTAPLSPGKLTDTESEEEE